MHNSTLYTRMRNRGESLARGERRDLKRAFLLDYIQHPGIWHPCVSRSCRAIGISRSCFYGWLRTDPLFSRKVNAINAVWNGSKDNYGLELIRKVNPRLLKEARERIIYLEYDRAYRVRLFAALTALPDTPAPDDTTIEDFLQDLPSIDITDIPCTELEALLESVRQQDINVPRN
jgi:hypothetical protein